MTDYKRLNLIIGWLVWIVAAIVYLATIEPTASFWDCGEFIAASFKLQVGHPPGAPFFLILAKFFTLFAPSPEHIAMMVNSLSALSSAFTILFLFWSITGLAKKLVLKSGELTKDKIFAIMGSGVVGALAYTFSDSFWFSAVEGEVYALSSLFTAAVFWAIIKWESVADRPHNLRWIILIAFLVGLSIGVHLLNLLAIPAIVMVYYYKKFDVTRKGSLIAFGLSIVLLAVVQYGIIPGTIVLASKFELLFVNSFGLPFNTGFVFYLLLLIGLVVWGLYRTHLKGKVIANTAILSFAVILLAYSTFAVILIRSNANPPMDENNPENVFTFLSYLNREQYGSRPLIKGQSFNSPLDAQKPYKDGSPTYFQDKETGKYIITDDGKNSVRNFDERFVSLLPRMWSDDGKHESHYKRWSKFKGKPIQYNDRGQAQTIMTPTFGDNMRYMFNYQLNWMYFRYFMWNFSGRQNDIQGHGNNVHGNWISGIKFIDEMRLGNQNNLPEFITENKGNNKYYMLPFLLGLLGMFYHFRKDKEDAIVVTLLFFFTGIAIVLYLNQYPLQPRERDYAYVGSFYAFAIWIGFGVLALYDLLSKKKSSALTAIGVSVLALLAVPTIMAKENWDDHSRAKRYTARDFAKNYLDSCEPNAILFTNGDNDTFPLWYVQDVEGYRTDVRVVNLSLLNTDWYINQMHLKAYESEPLPLSIPEKKIRQGTNDYLPIFEQEKLVGHVEVSDLVEFVKSENPETKASVSGGRRIDYIPTKKLKVTVDKKKVIENGTVSADMADEIVDEIQWTFNKSYVLKNDLTILDILATNNWERPVYFASTTGSGSYIGLEEYFRLEGMAYRLVPIKRNDNNSTGSPGFVDTDILYNRLMNQFHWGGMDTDDIYMDETNRRMIMSLRITFANLAEKLINEGKNDKAEEVLDRAVKVMPDKTTPYDVFVLYLAEHYYKVGADEKANAIVKRLADIYEKDFNYYQSLDPKYSSQLNQDKQQALAILNRLVVLTNQLYPQEELGPELNDRLGLYFGMN